MSLYKTSALPLGIEVFGIDLKTQLDTSVIEKIKEDVTKHRLVIFRNQGIIDGLRQVEISKWFGEIGDTLFSHHPKSPSMDVFRVSNDPLEGCTGIGMSGWHIDGTFCNKPYSHSIYHMVSVAKSGGNTNFIPLTEIVESFTPEQRVFLDRIWMQSDRLEKVCHPLIYPHHQTGRPTLCFHQGMTEAYVRDYQPNGVLHYLDDEDTNRVKEYLQNGIDSVSVYSHQWLESGDFIISDNLAIGHRAGDISSDINEAGLRILHRVTVHGAPSPCKEILNQSDCCY